MKTIVNRRALVDMLALACGVVPTRTPKPVLSCVRLNTASTPNGRVLRCVCTDLEITLETFMSQVDIKQEGVALLPANKLAEIVNNSPDETLTLDVHGEKTTLKGADSTFTLLGYNADEFPPTNGFEGAPDLTISAGRLKTLLDRTRFAAAREMTRYAMNGVLIERQGKKILMVATDGHRLAQARDEIDTDNNTNLSAIIPLKAIGLLERLLVDPELTVQLQFRENKMFVQILAAVDPKKGQGTVTASMSAALVEGTFPPYQEVIPKDCDHKAVLNRERFQSAVGRAALLTNQESQSVRLSLAPKLLAIIGRAPEMGEARVEMPIEYQNEAMDIGFNPIYLLDALKVSPAEEITLELRSPSKPGLLRSGNNFLYVIMPVNL